MDIELQPISDASIECKGDELDIHPNPDTAELALQASNTADASEDWKLKHQSMRGGIADPSSEGTLRRRSGYCVEWKPNKISAYYEKQCELLDGLQEVDELLSRHDSMQMDEPQPEKHVTLAINLSNLANLSLLASKVPLCVVTGSLAIIASVLDSVLDLCVGLLLWFTRRAVKNENKYKYPIGKARMQPLGIVVFAAIMGTASLQIMTQGFTDIFSPTKSEPAIPPLKNGIGFKSLLLLIVMIANIVLKGVLWLYCRTFENEIVKARLSTSSLDKKRP